MDDYTSSSIEELLKKWSPYKGISETIDSLIELLEHINKKEKLSRLLKNYFGNKEE